jgi:hypothetical protein
MALDSAGRGRRVYYRNGHRRRARGARECCVFSPHEESVKSDDECEAVEGFDRGLAFIPRALRRSTIVCLRRQ